MSRDVDVIIIGAGAAGIAAALELKKSSLSVIVLEARDRIGGRAFTDRETFAPTPVDLGASWIHVYGPKNPIYSFYQKYKGDEQSQSANYMDEEQLVHIDCDGTAISKELEQQAEVICMPLFECLEKFAATDDNQQDHSIEDVLRPEYDRLAMPQGQMKRIVDSFLAEFAVYEAEDLTDLSAKNWVTIDADGMSEKWVSFGYGTILERIVAEEKLTVELNTLVTRIDTQNPNRVAVTTSKNDFPIYCRYVLITVPLGCLKRETIAFEPPLPQWKREAIDQLGVGTMNKLILQFSECFWHMNTRTILRTCHKQRSRFLYCACLPSPANIMVFLVTGEHARQLEKLTDEEILEHVMCFLREIFPNSIVPYPIKYKFTRWCQDPLTYGCYSNFPVHANQHTVELLAKETSNGQVQWAGEHTDMNDGTDEWMSGCVHNAFSSGQRAARAIQKQFNSSVLNVVEENHT